MIYLLSSNRSDFISDYITLKESKDALYLENISKYLSIKYESIGWMLTRERLTLKQYHNKYMDATKDLVSIAASISRLDGV